MANHSRQVEALLDLVEQYRGMRCAELETAARAETQALLEQAHAAARDRVRRALTGERKRLERQIAAAEARMRTRARLREQQQRAKELRAAWQMLPAALQRRWDDAAARARWSGAVASRALALLPRRGWSVAHPPAWPGPEQEQFVKLTADRLDAAPRLTADAGIRAGLRVAAGDTVIDATLEGLLADREAVEARLLHHLAGSAP